MDVDFEYNGDVAAADRAAVYAILGEANFRDTDDFEIVSRKLHDFTDKIRVETVDALGAIDEPWRGKLCLSFAELGSASARCRVGIGSTGG